MEWQWHLLPWEAGQVLGLLCLLLGPLQAVLHLLPAPIWSSEQEPPQVKLLSLVWTILKHNIWACPVLGPVT